MTLLVLECLSTSLQFLFYENLCLNRKSTSLRLAQRRTVLSIPLSKNQINTFVHCMSFPLVHSPNEPDGFIHARRKYENEEKLVTYKKNLEFHLWPPGFIEMHGGLALNELSLLFTPAIVLKSWKKSLSKRSI